MSKQVTCSTKREHLNPHERIQGIGGVGVCGGGGLRMTQLQMSSGTRAVTMSRSTIEKVWVIVATHNGRKHIKTQADGYAPDNLLSLAEALGERPG